MPLNQVYFSEELLFAGLDYTVCEYSIIFSVTN